MREHGARGGAEPAWGSILPGIEGLRGIAAASVLVLHVGFEMAETTTTSNALWSVVGYMRHGLTLFFVLSGFLLFRQFAASIVGSRPAPRAIRFWTNRLWRILPAYVVVLLFVSLVLQTARLSSQSPESGADQSGTLGLWETLWSLPLLQTLNPDHVRTGLGVAWSLTTELTFYLSVPVLAVLAVWVGRRTRPLVGVWAAPVLMVAVGLAGKAYLLSATSGLSQAEALRWMWGHEWTAVFSRSILVHADLFGWGMGAAVVFVILESRDAKVARWVPLGMSGAALVMLLAVRAFALPLAPFDDTFVAAACALLVVAVAVPVQKGANGIGAFLDTPPMAWAGKVSYSVYLWHFPITWFLLKHDLAAGDSGVGFFLNLTAVLVLTYAASTITYRYVEVPGLAMKKRTDQRRKARTA